MKIISIHGSPRRRGNTAAALDIFEREMHARGHSTERILLADVKVNPCKSCWRCAKSEDENGCPQKDDAAGIFSKMAAADAIVYAVPLYCWCFPAQMKALIDRHVCLVKGFETEKHTSLIGGKKTALLVTCEGPEKDNADLIQIVFDRMCGYALMKVTGKFIIPGCGMEPGSLPADAEEIIRKMAASFD
ncbi:MAG TPA: flavodoxin family protein [bacterium]|nr:flavodoxin family protein [bacterium]